MSNIFCIDLGTCNIKIYNKDKNNIFNEKNVIAMTNKKQIFASGDEAYEMHEKAPANLSVTFPMDNGVIADYDNMQQLLERFLSKLAKTTLKSADYIIAVPTDITEVEKKAFHDLVSKSKLKPRNVLMAEKPVADAVGLGLDINSPCGMLVVDLGADTTEISVLSLGGIVLSKLLKLGGKKFDESIIAQIKKEYNLIIGEKTAKMLKEELASAIEPESRTVPAVGRDIVTGLPITIQIDAKLIYEALKEHIISIVDSIKMILERTPPELASDIIENGVYITGGSSQISNFPALITEMTELDVNICEEPSETVVKGLMKIVTDPEFRYVSYSMKMRNYK